MQEQCTAARRTFVVDLLYQMLTLYLATMLVAPTTWLPSIVSIEVG